MNIDNHPLLLLFRFLELLNKIHLFIAICNITFHPRIEQVSTAPVLDAEAAPGISPLDRTVDAGDLTGAALKTASVFHHHLPLLRKGIEIRRAGIDAVAFPASVTDLLIQTDMRLVVILKCIQSDFFSDLHLKGTSSENFHHRDTENTEINYLFSKETSSVSSVPPW